jgi:3',5'-cyclic AMP phosphodiesterase CpdA
MICFGSAVALHTLAASEPAAYVEPLRHGVWGNDAHRQGADIVNGTGSEGHAHVHLLPSDLSTTQPEGQSVGRQLSVARGQPRRRARWGTGARAAFLLPQAKKAAEGEPLLRFAVFGDTHFWSASPSRASWEKRAAAQPIRDGLLVDDADVILPNLLQQLSSFAVSGADFAVHTGDTICGGNTFGLTPVEFSQTLRHHRALEVDALGSWPVLHIPGNHDLDPNPEWPRHGGTRAWRRAMCANATRPLSRFACSTGSPNYSSVRAAGWRVLLLDAQDGLTQDIDGHGEIGAAQLEWMRSELEEAASKDEQVILVMHQILIDPSAGFEPSAGRPMPRSSFHRSTLHGRQLDLTRPQEEQQQGSAYQRRRLPADARPGASWLEGTQNFIRNRGEVLRLLSSFDNVRLSLHGHVHANSIATQQGIAFVTTASPIEYPMHWREVSVHECEIRLTTHAVDVPRQRKRSRQADRRPGRNGAKMGSADANSVIIRTCTPS